MKRLLATFAATAIVLLVSPSALGQPSLGQCIALPEETFDRLEEILGRRDPDCSETLPTAGRHCIDCGDPDQVKLGIGRCAWFLAGRTCALHLAAFDLLWSRTDTFECVGELGQEVPGGPFDVGELITILELGSANCVVRTEGEPFAGVVRIEPTGTPLPTVCGRHAKGSMRTVECARGAP